MSVDGARSAICRAKAIEDERMVVRSRRRADLTNDDRVNPADARAALATAVEQANASFDGDQP